MTDPRSSSGTAEAPTPTPWREWDVMRSDGKDEYPEPHVGDIRLVGSNGICIGVTFGGYASLPECNANAAFIVKAVNAHADLVKALDDARSAIASLPEDALGMANDDAGQWPIRDELLSNIDAALSQVRP
jgi:hypothetical protein